MKLRAYAKINLGLQVLNKRPDGFHNISGVFCKVDLFDEIILEESGRISLTCDVDLGIPPEKNLVFKAAEAFRSELGGVAGAKISLKKKIPSGAGLGGGSSDAAATLLGLAELARIPADDPRQVDIAARLGSDVPFFLKPGAAEASGRGEILDYFDLEIRRPILIVFADEHVSTKEAYEALNRGFDSPDKVDFRSLLLVNLDDLTKLKNKMINDFELPIFERIPKLGEIKRKLYDFGAEYSSMSGSGSAIFGFFPDRTTAEKAREHFSDVRTWIVRQVP